MAEDVKVPEGWRRVRLGDLGEFKTSSVDKKIREKEIPVKLINYMDVYQHNFITKNMELMEVTANRHQFITNRVIKGDVLFTPTSETPDDIGHSAVVLDDLENTVYSYHLIRLRFNNDNSMDIKFRGYVFNSRSILHQFEILATGVTRFTLSKEDFKEVSVIYPESQAKQRKIAEILETIDNAIEKTDKIIEKYKRIKQALMQDLLTKGIDENGQIRSEEMHRFKDSPLGRIPEEWKVVELGEIFNISAGGDIDKLNFSYDKSNTFKYPIYSNTLEDKGLYGYADSYRFPENSITITARGVLGIAIPRFEKFNAIIRLLVLIPKDKVNITFVSEYINTFVNFYIEETGVPQLTAPKASDRLISLPSLPEQQRIASILSQIDEAIEKEQKCKEKLERIKQGLMQDLLTGKVRVNHLISKEVKV